MSTEVGIDVSKQPVSNPGGCGIPSNCQTNFCNVIEAGLGVVVSAGTKHKLLGK